MNAKFVDAQTGDETIIELDAEQVAEIEKRDEEYRAQLAQAKAKREALLEKLGITEDEATLLLS